MITFFSPGQYVRHTKQPDWGLGQVQSAVADRITVNFEHAGKQLIIGGLELVVVSEREIVESRAQDTKGN
ncbi:hypothetical protein A9Q83_16790 [Alphaproteobacteria bacterium 46_93_T64]|nr:hypothetical protein A9Q83_16790 [Alphaproteobacteria bacterium 46_93_T64]